MASNQKIEELYKKFSYELNIPIRDDDPIKLEIKVQQAILDAWQNDFNKLNQALCNNLNESVNNLLTQENINEIFTEYQTTCNAAINASLDANHDQLQEFLEFIQKYIKQVDTEIRQALIKSTKENQQIKFIFYGFMFGVCLTILVVAILLKFINT